MKPKVQRLFHGNHSMKSHFNTLYIQHLQLPHSKADDAEFL
jgi:hypothetical protein